MSDISTRKINYRVVVDVESYRWAKVRHEKDMLSEAQAIIEQVRRHVDKAQDAHMEWDTVCAHCFEDPEIDKVEGPVCCQKAIDEWEANKPK